MKINSAIVFLLLFSKLTVAQTDSTFNKYGHFGISIGSSLNYCNFNNLRAQGYMLGIPSNLQFLPLGGSLSFGKINKFYGSLEFAGGGQNRSGTYTYGLNSFSNMKVSLYETQFGLYLNHNIYFGKNFAVDGSLGSSFRSAIVSSVNEYSPVTKEIFANSTIRQDGDIYLGTTLRLFWSAQHSGDVGFNLKIGYNIPTTKATWHSSTPINVIPPQVNLGGPIVSLSFSIWSYNYKYLMKNMKYNPYMYRPVYVKDTVPAPTDSTKSLFKNLKYSYIQWDGGYCGMNIKKTFLNGFDISLFGIVFNKKYFTSLGIAGFVDNAPNIYATPPPKTDSYVAIYWNNELLVHPDHLINFSFPLKIAYVGASGWDQNASATYTQAIFNWNFSGQNYYEHSGEFFTVTPGANIFINIFKPLSLGVGANYRFAFGVPKIMGTNSDYSSYSVNVFLRLKFDTKAMNKKMMERQKEIWGNEPKQK